jgi:hypothetical protein
MKFSFCATSSTLNRPAFARRSNSEAIVCNVRCGMQASTFRCSSVTSFIVSVRASVSVGADNRLFSTGGVAVSSSLRNSISTPFS